MTERTIWDLVREASESLPEPFSRSALLAWVRRARPDVEESSVATHIQYATANAVNASNPFRGRTPLLERIGRGEYRRHRGPGVTAPERPAPAQPARFPSSADVVLVGCSSRKASSARPAAELFTGAAFTKARELARRGPAPWYVLSAKFGLLDPAEVVAPYDVYLADQPRTYRTAWGAWVVAQLAQRHELAGTVVEVHAGRDYCEPLAAPLAASGATLSEPLAGLGLGERLAWYGSARPSALPDAVDVSLLLDERNAVAPAAFLAAGRTVSDQPGLYTWWVDAVGARQLSAGLGHPVASGLVYAGRAGGLRPNGKVSSNTLWGRVGGMHLQGNRDFSTFRLTLTAALSSSDAGVADEAGLSGWMHAHLRVAVLPLPAEAVFAAEERLLEAADPPLNLSGVPRTELRRVLSQLRSRVSAGS